MCDAACRLKILLNGGFMAVLAPELADRLSTSKMRDAAMKLGKAARLQSELLATAGFMPPVDAEGFTGCEQATLLNKWINAMDDKMALDHTEVLPLLATWTAEIRATIGDIVSGKFGDDQAGT